MVIWWYLGGVYAFSSPMENLAAKTRETKQQSSPSQNPSQATSPAVTSLASQACEPGVKAQ